jgi:hypothetical protein
MSDKIPAVSHFQHLDKHFCEGMTKQLAFAMAIILLAFTPLMAAKKNKEKAASLNPYDTAELEAPPKVDASDLVYRTILLEDFKIPKKEEKDATEPVAAVKSRVISRLKGNIAFTSVDSVGAKMPEEAYLLVKCALLESRIVSGRARFWWGGMAGTSYMAFAVKILDGKSGSVLNEFDVTTENNIWSAGWSGWKSDKGIPYFLGNVIADYVSLRARTDKGASIVPLEKVVQDGAVYTPPDAKLMWSAKDNHENISWDQASQFAKDFHAGNFSDWRLPTVSELKNLYVKDNEMKLANGKIIHITDQVMLSAGRQWAGEENGKSAQCFDFEKGNAASQNKEESYPMRVLVVRDVK